jgi:hypothetical protein
LQSAHFVATLSSRIARSLEHFMKTRCFIFTMTLVATLIAPTLSATAEEHGSVQTPLSNTTVSGSVNTTAGWQAPAKLVEHAPKGWWGRFFYLLKVYRLR